MIHRVVFVDVDGTLVPATSSGQHLAEHLGHAGVVREAEAAYAAGTMGNQRVSELDAEGWAGHRPGEIDGLLATLPLVDGIAETVAWCRDHDLVPVLATLAWEPVGSYLCRRFGFERSCGPRLEIAGGVFTGRVASHFDEWDKRDFAREVAADLTRCAAIGDSRSDLPLFAEVGLSIAFNATPEVRGLAHEMVDSPDLRAIIPVLTRRLLF